MAKWRPAVWLPAIVGVLLALPASAQAPKDVPQDHWAYQAIQDLASKGLIKGFPASGDFFGGRTVTRYEMATIVDRAVARVEDLIAKLPQPQAAPSEPGVKPEQLDEVRKLVDEFRVELTVIGADLDKVKAELGEMRQGLSDLRAGMAKTNADVAEAKAGSAAAKKAAQDALDANKKTAAAMAGKVDAGYGKLKVTGTIQVWASLEKDAPNRGSADTFRLRRMQVNFQGNPTPKTYFSVLIDPAAQLALNTTSSGGNLTTASVNTSTYLLLDGYIGYILRPDLNLQVGQMKLPLSYDGMRSSAQLPTVERAIFNVLPYNQGRFGNAYDIGMMLKYSRKTFEAQLGAFDDGGNRQNSTDDNNGKEIMWHAQYKGVRNLLFGGYQSISGGVNGNLNTLRHRIGAEAVYTLGKHWVEAEVVRARDAVLTTASTPTVANPAVYSEGYYLLYGYKVSKNWDVVGRGEYWNPDRNRHGSAQNKEYDLTLGVNYYMPDYHSKIQFNWVRKNINGPLNAAGTGPAALSGLGLDRNMFMVNFQQAF